MKTLEEVQKDPNFYTLDPQVQRNILEKVDPKFMTLGDKAKDDVVNNLDRWKTKHTSPELPPEVISAVTDFHQLPFEEQTQILDKDRESPFAPTDISTITGRPTAELEGRFPDFMKVGDVAADWAPDVLATIGGMLGIGVGAWAGPVGLAGGGVGGAAIGGVTGETLKQSWYQITGRGELPKTQAEYWAALRDAGIDQATYEIMGAGLGVVAGRSAKKLSKTAGILIKKGTERIRPTGAETMALDKSGKTLMEGLERIGSLPVPWGGAAAARKQKLKLLSEHTNEIVGISEQEVQGDFGKWLSTSLQRMGKTMQESIIKNDAKIIKQSIDLKLTTNIAGWKNHAELILKSQERSGLVQPAFLKNLVELGDILPYPGAERIRQQLDILYKSEKHKNIKASYKSLFTRAEKGTRETILNSGDGKIIKLYEGLKKTNNLYPEFTENRIVVSVIEKMDPRKGGDPTGILSYFEGTGGYQRIKTIKELLKASENYPEILKFGKKANLELFQEEIFYDLIKKSTVEKEGAGILNGQLLQKNIKNLSKEIMEKGEKTSVFKEMFDPGNKTKAIEHLAETMAKMEGTGKARIVIGYVGSAMLYGGGGYGFLGDPEGSAGKVAQVGATVMLPIAVFSAMSRTRLGLRLFALLAKTKPEKTGPILIRIHNMYKRQKIREAWLEQREEKRTSERKEMEKPEQPATNPVTDLLRGILPTQHPKTKPIINQTVGGTRASLGGNNDFLTQLLLS